MNDLVDAPAGTRAAPSSGMQRPVGSLRSVVASSIVWLAAACSATPGVPDPSPAALEQASGFEAMTPEAQATVRGASVRFLLLLPAPYARSAIATSGSRWSALSARVDALTVSLHGTNTTHDAHLTLDEVQRAEPTRTVRGAAARVLVNEGIRSVAWNEHGVDWSLEVECYAPDTDVRCTEDAFVVELAARLEEPPQ